VKKTNTIQLPYIIRKERFGGILFDPADATLLELDHEGTELVSAYVKNSRLQLKEKERKFIKKIKQTIHYQQGRDISFVDVTRDVQTDYEFNVFSAPTLVDFQITNRCYMNCSHCYASSTPDGKHASLDDVKRVIDNSVDCGVCQIALGGGEPLLHPDIYEILDYCHEKGIVPNLSTNGMHLTKKNLLMLKHYCGAVAVSLENTGEKCHQWRRVGCEHIHNVIRKFKSYAIPTVIQITLGEANFGDLDHLVDFCLDYPHLYGVIFLAYKPVGRGEHFSGTLFSLDSTKVSTGLKKAFHRLSKKVRVGYDCCLAPAIAGNGDTGFVHKEYLEGCSAVRSSVGVSPELDVIPCTFLGDYVLGNLKQDSLAEIWNNTQAKSFRDLLKKNITKNNTCSTCQLRNCCLGGCPVMDLAECCIMMHP
jgi:radical SAM protein with 4Fe4S-binding SPASM domain